MRLKTWCKHIRQAKPQLSSAQYEWFDHTLNAWRPLAEVWRRCPVCKNPAPSMQRSWWQEWTVWLSLLGMMGVCYLVWLGLSSEYFRGVRWLP